MKKIRLPVSIPAMAQRLGVGESTVYKWVRRKLVPTTQGFFGLQVPGVDAERIIDNWNKSCTQAEAADFLGVGNTTVNVMIAEGKLKSIELLGKTRVLINSLIKALASRRLVRPEDVLYPNRRGFARLTPQKASELSLRTWKIRRKRRK